MSDLLIAGGRRDTNLPWLADIAARIGLPCRTLMIDETHSPAFSWNLEDGVAQLDGAALDCRACFIRYDVFTALQTGRQELLAGASAWYAAVDAWCAAADVFTLNAEIHPQTASKPWMLGRARAAGLEVPPTLVSNVEAEIAKFRPADRSIAKPVAGGSYVVDAPQAIAGTDWLDGTAPHPAIVQPKLAYPERRIYRAGPAFFVFDIASETLDSRLDPKMRITELPATTLPAGLLDRLREMTDDLCCDFCAIDMKTDPLGGDLVFLELNTGPMLRAYDEVAGGRMGEALLRYLMAGGGPT
ncbi:hypothetical protein [Devosia sp.]|uniref:hypothetical protein n=1 Tax=Devosia sp. TaxID=1871048 RepID=UPI003A955B82